MMGFTALLCQTFAGDVIDKTRLDRRSFLTLASMATAFSASAVLFVHEGNVDHAMMYSTKVIEGISSSFIGPCVASLTLATFGPDNFDDVMASNVLWGHVGSIASAILAGLVGYFTYPDIKYCFLVIGFSAICAVCGVQFLIEGDPLMGRGLQTQNQCSDKNIDDEGSRLRNQKEGVEETSSDYVDMKQQQQQQISKNEEQILVSSYWSIFFERKTVILCLTGFFFHFANANVLLVLGELMGGDNEDGSVKRSAIPLSLLVQ